MENIQLMDEDGKLLGALILFTERSSSTGTFVVSLEDLDKFILSMRDKQRLMNGIIYSGSYKPPFRFKENVVKGFEQSDLEPITRIKTFVEPHCGKHYNGRRRFCSKCQEVLDQKLIEMQINIWKLQEKIRNA